MAEIVKLNVLYRNQHEIDGTRLNLPPLPKKVILMILCRTLPGVIDLIT